ncbi:alpha/beta hydrolase [Mycetocola sp. 2940]|uniref:alpha/beta fold hydrolase n=1 Tax=Mycetocola sp. 2940 TaxID=3156452 RepID=UPI003399A96B
MDVVLVPGFWLKASSWDPVIPALKDAGHRAHPLTLPGLESFEARRTGIGLRDHVDAVVARIDSLGGPVALVGHSGGGAIIHAAVDARPDRVVRAVYVDSGPLADGFLINDEVPSAGDDLPLPDWSEFSDADLVDLDDRLRRRFREIAVPEPRGVAFDRQELSDERRYDVPVTVITCTFPSAAMREAIDSGAVFTAELAKVNDYEIVDLPTGHWPQFTKPRELAEALVEALRER